MAVLPLVGGIRGAPRTLAITAVAAGFVLSAVATQQQYRSFDRSAAELVAFGDRVPEGALMLPLDSAPLDQPVRPYLHLWSYICLQRDCLAPYLFAQRYTQNIYFKQPLAAPPEGPPGWRWDALATALTHDPYSVVLLHGRSAALERRLATTMRLARVTPSASLYIRSDPPAAPWRTAAVTP